MVSFARKLLNVLPVLPRKRYSIFAGTNTRDEWFAMINECYSRRNEEPHEVIGNYERQFASACSAKYGISFGAGRMALYAILQAFGIGEGDEVIIPAFTCVVVPNAILYSGAIPIYVDIDPDTFNIDILKIESKITENTKALYAQHTFGVPCDIERLKELGKKYDIPVIEDGAHALGASYKGKSVGSLSDVAFFTTDHSKVINTHLGGMVVTNNEKIASRIYEIQAKTPFLSRFENRKLIRSFLLEYLFLSPFLAWLGRTIIPVLNRLGFLFYFSDEMLVQRPTAYPYPCRLSSAQAKLGLLQLNKLKVNIGHRRRIAKLLEENIHWYNYNDADMEESAWLRYSFLVKNRDEFIKRFHKHFDLGIWFTSVVYGRFSDFDKVGYLVGSCPVAEYVAEHVVNFPTHMRIPLSVIRDEADKNSDWLTSNLLRYSDYEVETACSPVV